MRGQGRWVQAIIMVLIVLLSFGWIRHAEAETGQDARKLLAAAGPFVNSNHIITFKYTSYFGSCEGTDANVQKAGAVLANALGFPGAAGGADASIYSSRMTIVANAEASLTVASPEGQQACYAVVRLDTAGSVDESQLLGWQEQMDGKLQEQGVRGNWNVMVQGYVSSEKMADSPERLLDDIVLACGGKVVESYSDAHTFSRSMVSGAFKASVQSGEHTVNAQVALHQDSTSGEWRVTVGTPLITMEY
ncbi:YwmB family TATA-box binding protein [Paenibacillus oryzisoli]|uniref:YwmB family TATA-box binding protein n=1 Tax=Paenibacillus oryzisoli TaxID=1850517 RepID=UPI003D2830D8